MVATTSEDSWPDYTPQPHGQQPADLSRRHRDAPVAPVTLPSGDSVDMIVSYDDVRAVLACPASSRQVTGRDLPRLVTGTGPDDVPGTIINMDNPEHARLRRLVAGAFTPAAIERWRASTNIIAHCLLDELPGPIADLATHYAAPLSSRVICRVLGVPNSDYDKFHAWSEAFLSTSTASAQARADAYATFMEYIADLVARHRAHPGDDLVDALIHARDDGDRLGEDELVNLLFTVLVAGHETTSVMITRGVYRLLLHEQYQELCRDPRLIPAAIEEILRYDGPASNGMLRRMTADTVLPSGAMLAAGSVVLPNPLAANHDPAAFPDPGRFDIHRGSRNIGPHHLAFGHGPHFCLGASLARMEMQEALAALTERAPGLKPAIPLDDIAWTMNASTQRPVELPVRLN